jgi:hypothetical protein
MRDAKGLAWGLDFEESWFWTNQNGLRNAQNQHQTTWQFKNTNSQKTPVELRKDN